MRPVRQGEHMKANVGTIDRAARVIIGVALIALAATGTVGIWGYIGLVPLATALFRFCPAYVPLGINTCPLDTDQQSTSPKEWQ